MKSSLVSRAARCPACKKTLDAATDPIGNATPKPNDTSICGYCSEIGIFQTDLTLRSATHEDMESLSPLERHELSIMQLVVRARIAGDLAEAS